MILCCGFQLLFDIDYFFNIFSALIFVYNYHPDSESLQKRHFNSNETMMNGYNDPFSSDPNAPRPYSHTKNAILRHQHRLLYLVLFICNLFKT